MSGVFFSSLLEHIYPHLPPEIQSATLQWVHGLSEEAANLVEDKIGFLTACAAAAAEGRDVLLAEAEHLVLALPEPKRDEARATIQRHISPGRDRLRRHVTSTGTSYSRDALIAEVRKGGDLPRSVPDPFELLIEQGLKEVEGATVEALRTASAGERSSLLRAIARLGPAIHRLAGEDAIDGVVAALRENVESWG